MTTEAPTRCCAPATSGRCSNAPAPHGQSRYIGPVEIAACNQPRHQAALRSLPGFTRRDGVCGADGCGKPIPLGLCPDHRHLYQRHGISPRALLATEPTMPAPAPDVSVTVQLDALTDAQRAIIVGSDTTIKVPDAVVPPPPAAPQEAAGGGATSEALAEALDWRALGIRWQIRVRIGLIYDIEGLKFVRDSLKSGRITPNDEAHAVTGKVEVAPWMPIGSAADLAARMVAVHAGLTTPKPAAPDFLDEVIAASGPGFAAKVEAARGVLDRATGPGTDGASDGESDTIEPSADDVEDAQPDPLHERREAVVARLRALGFEEHEDSSVLWLFRGHGYSVPVPLPDHDNSLRKAEDMLDEAERLCRRLEKGPRPQPSVMPASVDNAGMAEPAQPMSPDLAAIAGPPAELEARAIAAERLAHGAKIEVRRGRDAVARLEKMLAEAEQRANAAEQQLAAAEQSRHAISESLGKARLAEAYAKRELEAAEQRADRAEQDAVSERARGDLLGEDAATQRARADAAEAQLSAIAEMLDPADSPAWDANDQPIPLPTRVQVALMPASASDIRRLEGRDAVNELQVVCRFLRYLGATAYSAPDMLLQVLSTEDRRNILEVEAAELRAAIARLKARRLNPPPEGRLEEYAADLAKAEAALAELPSLPPSATPLADDLRDLVARIRCDLQPTRGGQDVAILEGVYDDLRSAADRLARVESRP